MATSISFQPRYELQYRPNLLTRLMNLDYFEHRARTPAKKVTKSCALNRLFVYLRLKNKL